MSVQTRQVKKYLDAVILKDKTKTNQLIEGIVDSSPTILDAFDVIAKAQSRVGQMWAQNKITVADEHYASQIALDAIRKISTRFQQTRNKIGTCVMFCVEDEMHYVGLKMFAETLSKIGWDVEFLGDSVPSSQTIRLLEKIKPEMICISFSMIYHTPNLLKTVSKIRKISSLKNAIIIVGSRHFRQSKFRQWFTKNSSDVDYFTDNITDAITYVSKLEKLSRGLRDNLEQLKNRDQKKDEFVSMVIHDLSNPLVTISNAAHIIEATGKLDERQIKMLKLIHSSAKRAHLIVKDLSEINKLELGKIEFNFQTHSVNDIINEAVEPIQFEDIKHKVMIGKNINKITADKQRLIQVITNLITNAIKYVDAKDGKITISVKDQKDRIVFAVKDNGPGIPEKYQKGLFSRFYQVESNKKMGSGLGLAICKEIVSAHRGSIWLNCKPDRGAEFCFAIPKK